MFVSRSVGFTLVELLVIIAIVGIMAALLFPSFSGISESFHSAKCISNLRQLGQAALQFSTDNDNYLPPAFWATGTNSSSVLNPYLEDAPTRVLCPSARAITNRAYGINMALEAGHPPPWGENDHTFWRYSACRISQLSKPTGIILFADSPPSGNNGTGSYIVNHDLPFMSARIGIRHSGGKKFNASFVDGHAESLTANYAQTAGFWTNGLPNLSP
ncbi:MAG: type II secretion system protein [Syntrophales bacterium]